MNQESSTGTVDTNEEVRALTATLIETERRLEEITLGEVDTVVGWNGRPFLLGRAQEQLRYREAKRQETILDALPAHIALLDAEGVILSVNEAWRQFADANVFHAPRHGVGLNYLDVCDQARGLHSSEASQVAAGIRSVMGGSKKDFSIEYPCHSPTEQRWFQLMVTPLAEDHAIGVVVMHINVTERKRVEQTLRASEANLSTAQRIAHFGSWEQDLANLDDPSANPLRWSDEMFRIAGYEPGSCEVTTDFFFHLVPAAEREAIHKAFAAAIRERQDYSIVHRLIRPNGEVRTVHETAQVSFEANSHAMRVSGTCHDITERKLAEEAVREHDERLRAALSASGTGTFRWDFQTTEVKWDDSLDDLFGVPRDQTAHSLGAFVAKVHPDDRSAVMARCEQCQRAGSDFAMEFRILWPDGSERWLDDRGKTFLDAAGKPLYMTGACVDITERKQAEALLRESEARFASAFEDAPIGVALVSPEGRWIKANRVCCDLFGYPEAELLTLTFEDLTYPEDIQLSLENVRRAIAGEFRSFQIEKRYIHKRGHIISALLNISLVRDGQGQPSYFISQIQDITERKKAENALRQNHKHLRGLIDGMGPAMFVGLLTTDGVLIEVNRAPLVAAGLKMEDVVGKPFAETPWWSQSPPAQQQLREAIVRAARGESSRYDVRVHGANSEIIDIDFSLQPLRDETGAIAFLVPSASVITERKLAENAIRESNEKFHQLADNITDAFWIRSPDFSEVQYVSAAFEKIWGRSRASLVANPHQWTEFIFAEDRARVLAAFSRLSTGASSLDIEYRIVRPDGEIRWVRVRGFQIRNAADQLIRHLGVVTDITEWRQATDALRTSEAEFRALAEAMPQIVWETGADGGNTYFNQQWMDYTGLTLEESHGDGWLKPFHPDDREAARLSWQTATSNAGTYSIESRLRRADGAYRWWLVRGAPLKDTNGHIIRWAGTCTDIDDLKLAQEQMSQQAALLNIAQDAILVKDLQDRIIYWNKSAERTYGWTSEEAVGSSSGELLQQEPGARQEAQAKLLAHGSWQGEMISRTKAGSEVTADVRWTLVKGAHGQPKSVLAIHTDITGKKKLEAQFLRVQRMESIGTLASGIAHDLNNVLAPIMMSLEMLKDIALTPGDKSLLATLQSCSQRGADLIRQVLSFARGVEGRRVSINVLHIIHDIENIIRDTFPKNISFEIKRPREVGTVLGDPTQLHQVFMNLCVNSRDAMPLGGKLTVALENVVVDEIFAGMNPDAKVGPYTMIKVTDTGSGIPLAIQNKIFEPFYTTKEIGKGTGLGLSTTTAIIKSHGGFISLYSEPGQGAEFKIYLPAVLNSKAPKESEFPETRLPIGNDELVLVVDDEESIRTITQKTLERFNYRAMLARNGAEAVAVYATHGSEIAVVLTDMAMPIMDGPALIVALTALNPNVKIIGCSGYASNHDLANAMGTGVQHFIPKPYPAEILLKTLRLILKGGEKP